MRRIDGYEIFAELQRGPGTTIFKALDNRHNRVVLIKLLEAGAVSEDLWRLQLLRESRLSARLSHPNLRRIFQSGLGNEEPFLVLEYVEGPTLAELIGRHKKLPIDVCIYIAKELAKAISAIHRNHVLHRDIKPHNIFLSLEGQVKLGDLGMAQDLSDVETLIAGTPAYMSPEQVLGQEVSEASDLFSFGAVLYEMLTGESAFGTRSITATLHHLVNWEPVSISKVRPETPRELVEICQKLLTKNSRERYPNAETVFDFLIWLERGYGLCTTSAHLAEFLQSPESYRQTVLTPVDLATLDKTPKVRKHHHLSWGVTAVLNATMFLAGVLFIKGVKTYFERRAEAAAPNVATSVYRPASAERLGFLDLQVTPSGSGSMVQVEDDSTGIAPLTTPLTLPPGWHEISITHPRLGVKKVGVSITAGDTLRKTVDFSSY